jgi:hypothetical protein
VSPLEVNGWQLKIFYSSGLGFDIDNTVSVGGASLFSYEMVNSASFRQLY